MPDANFRYDVWEHLESGGLLVSVCFLSHGRFQVVSCCTICYLLLGYPTSPLTFELPKTRCRLQPKAKCPLDLPLFARLVSNLSVRSDDNGGVHVAKGDR